MVFPQRPLVTQLSTGSHPWDAAAAIFSKVHQRFVSVHVYFANALAHAQIRTAKKVMLDCLVYGTAANSFGIVVRRVCFRGESLGEALAVWDERILSVIRSEVAP